MFVMNAFMGVNVFVGGEEGVSLSSHAHTYTHIHAHFVILAGFSKLKYFVS